jgi:nitrogen fixation/metabolism regulation signal transduction histidine kinase
MGLPMAERICQEHGGAMDLSCPAGGGCVVRLYLPRDPAASAHVSP